MLSVNSLFFLFLFNTPMTYIECSMHKIIGQTTLHFKSHISLVKTHVFTIVDSKSSSIKFPRKFRPMWSRIPLHEIFDYFTQSVSQIQIFQSYCEVVEYFESLEINSPRLWNLLSIYLVETLLGGQLRHVLWWWHIGFMSPKTRSIHL